MHQHLSKCLIHRQSDRQSDKVTLSYVQSFIALCTLTIFVQLRIVRIVTKIVFRIVRIVTRIGRIVTMIVSKARIATKIVRIAIIVTRIVK